MSTCKIRLILTQITGSSRHECRLQVRIIQQTSMASLTPLVLEGISLPEFLQYVMDKHAPPSTIVVCSSREAFIKQLQASFNENTPQKPANEREPWDETTLETLRRLWSTPTLRLLASSRTVKMVFCPDVTHLHAYLAAYASRVAKEPTPEVERPLHPRFPTSRLLAILNPIAVHRPTPSFSVQGINRTLALAVEAAYHSKSRLVLFECPADGTSPSTEDAMMIDEQPVLPVTHVEEPWDEEVSILNVTTKTFGAGERGWVGRTVKARTIAERWCVFQKMDAA